jgi:hypothetical protein
VERSKQCVRIGGSLSVGFGRRRGAAGRIARSTEIRMLKGLRAPLRHNVTRSPCRRPIDHQMVPILPGRLWILESKAYPDIPTLRSTQSLQPKSCRSSHSLLAGQVAGAVLLLLDARKVSVIHTRPRLPKAQKASEHNCPKTWTYVFFCVQLNPVVVCYLRPLFPFRVGASVSVARPKP